VVLDTFRAGFIRLFEASKDDITRLRDAIIPIYRPEYDDVQGGSWLGDGGLVVGYISERGAYVYPVKILNLHEIVNDVIDRVPFLVSYCSSAPASRSIAENLTAESSSSATPAHYTSPISLSMTTSRGPTGFR